MESFLTTAQVRERLGVSAQTLSYWRARNIGPISVKILGSVRYPAADFEQWLAAQVEQTARGEKVTA